jgi:hypothetical protein
MRRTVAIAVLAGTIFMSIHEAPAQDVVGGALMGAAIGGYVGGITSGRADGAIGGMIAGGTAGTIIGSDVEKRPGYYWRDGNCYHRVRGNPVRVTRRYCY